jgi:hypothetical protein
MSDQVGKRPGPDFTVTDIQTAKGKVSIYEGCCSSVSGDKKIRFIKIDGHTIYRTFSQNGFSGYLTTQIEGEHFHHQVHFFGDGLYGDERDLGFFQRVRLGDYATKRCAGAGA